MAQVQRERTIDQLRKGKLDILVATDVAARGLDVERISHVINHDIPTDTESYVHRIGRTGRAGRSGQAISFVTPRETYLLRSIEKANRTTLEQMSLPTVEDVNAFRVAKFTEAIGQALATRSSECSASWCSPTSRTRRARRGHRRRDRRTRAGRRAAVPRGHAGAVRRSVGARGRAHAGGNLVRWRISVGKRHRVEPRQIVGALANEGGLKRADFGRIDIKPDFSLVELPPDLSAETLGSLDDTRISGILIDLQPDSGRPADVRAKSKYQAKGKKEAGRPQASGNPRKPRHQKSGR